MPISLSFFTLVWSRRRRRSTLLLLVDLKVKDDMQSSADWKESRKTSLDYWSFWYRKRRRTAGKKKKKKKKRLDIDPASEPSSALLINILLSLSFLYRTRIDLAIDSWIISRLCCLQCVSLSLGLGVYLGIRVEMFSYFFFESTAQFFLGTSFFFFCLFLIDPKDLRHSWNESRKNKNKPPSLSRAAAAFSSVWVSSLVPTCQVDGTRY